jgi:hypothetical protein
MVIKKPGIQNRFRTLDFGTGFYTTSNKAQAEEFALKVFQRRGKQGVPSVSVFEYDEATTQQLDILTFESPNEEWLDFVVHNRQHGRADEHDIIIGPVANDDVFATIALYEVGELSKDETIARFKVKSLYDQYLFCNETALQVLTYLESYTVVIADGQ